MKAVLVCCLLALGLTTAVCAESELTPRTITPDGSYRIARLELSSGLEDAEGRQAAGPQRMMLGLRDGRLASIWIVRPFDGDRRLVVERSTLQLKDDVLAGDVFFRTAAGRQRPQVDLTLKLDLRIRDDQATGGYEIACDSGPYRPTKGTAQGKLIVGAPADDQLAPQSSWKSYWGSEKSAHQPRLIDDLHAARPVWRSETHIPTGYGNAPDSRYFTRAVVSGNGGGGSSPVIAGGMVYMYYYLPSPQSAPVLKGNPYWERSYADEAAFDTQMASLHANQREKAQVLNHFRALADDHIVAIDAATGAEKWHTVLPLRSPNLQTHKHRGTSGVPLVVDGTLYVTNLMGRLYAVDAQTGKLKWELPKFEVPEKTPQEKPAPIPSPLMLADNLILAQGAWHIGTVLGLDPATGRQKWQAPGGYVMRWTHGDQERLLVIAGHDQRRLYAIDTRDGKVLWQQATELTAMALASAMVIGDMLLAAPAIKRGGPSESRYEGWKLDDNGAARVWQDEPLPVDENTSVTPCDGRAYLVGRQKIRVLQVQSGKQVLEKTFETGAPGSNAWLGVVGDRLLLSPEGQHGSLALRFFDKDLRELGPLWTPPNLTTTAYAYQPIIYPLVDGRLFVRGGDAIYCYDVRADK